MLFYRKFGRQLEVTRFGRAHCTTTEKNEILRRRVVIGHLHPYGRPITLLTPDIDYLSKRVT